VSLPESESTRTSRRASPRGSARITVYDLRDRRALEQASTDLYAWGRQWTEIHPLDNDHVAIEFKPGGALEASA